MRSLISSGVQRTATILPKGRKYRILVDRDNYIVDKESVTGREILILALKTPPERYQLRQKLKGGEQKIIGLDQTVDLTEPGIEKFKTLPLDQTDGACLKCEFDMISEDVEYLESLGLSWEASIQDGVPWLFIHEFPIPQGYNVEKATIGIRIVTGYPQAPLDMAYFHPPLSRVDGIAINGLSLSPISNQQFQQWSRHRTAQNPWIPGSDNLSTHLPLAEFWLLNEFNRHPHAVLT